MKKLSIFLLGAIGIMASSCEESIEPSIPQYNPQGPIVTLENVTSEKAGVLASSSVLTLENYRDDVTGIPVMTLVKTDSLPKGATVAYKLQLSATEDFAKEVTVDTKAGEPAEDGSIIYYVDANKWNDAHLTLFGKSPKEKTVYYRVPAYIDLDGSDYRLNSTDYYVAQGTIQETCFDMGFVIEDAYYLLGGSTTWDLAQATNYRFYHDPDVSVYDDPVFTYVFSVSQEVLDANGGGCYWKIAPQSAVDSNSWDNVLGCETDGDTATEGMLTTQNAGAGKITEAGRYEITINMESMAYTVKHLANVVYIVGQPNGWNIDNDALYLSETANSSNIYSGVLKIEAGQFMFRLYSQLGNWDKSSIGSQDADASIDIAFNDAGVYEGDIFQGGVNCSSGKGNWNVPNWEGGAVEITVDLNTNKIVMKKAPVNSGIYLRGGMNGWGADPAYEFILTDKVSTWKAAGLSIAADTEFKVADADWAAVNLGAGADASIAAGVAFPLENNGGNIKMSGDFKGSAVLTQSGSQYTLTLEAE